MHELERTGASRAEVLRVRASVGLLAPERLRAAAILGDVDALDATVVDGEPVPSSFCPDHDALARWAPSLAALDDEALRRVVVVAVSAWVDALSQTPWRGVNRDVVLPSCTAAIAAFDRFLRTSGDDAARREVATVAEGAWRLRWPVRVTPVAAPARVLVSEAGYLLATRALGRDRVARLVVRTDEPPPGTSQRAAKRAGVGAGRVRNTLRSALVDWLLA